MGELHLDVTSRKLQSKYGAEAVLQDPRSPIARRYARRSRFRAVTRSRPAVMVSLAMCG